ncbi:MAG TPA: FAD-dependent monooxygenase [Candidatus Dormibacteraeota bacterium]|nr:FAD-dependent monooxygenase [Candidatus Dormibacteraeota bacterium]
MNEDLFVTDVVVAGAGPVGLMLACELALAEVSPLVIERLPRRLSEPKANGMAGQVVRLLDHRGLYERFSGRQGAPEPAPGHVFGAMLLPLADLDANPMYMLPMPQRELERQLEERAGELGVRIRRGHELLGLAQDQEGVTLEVRGPEGPYRIRTRYLAGCDGGHSPVRKALGIDFPGVTEELPVSRTVLASLPESMTATPGTLDLPVLGLLTQPIIRTERGVFSFLATDPARPLLSTLEWGEWRGGDAPLTMEEMAQSLRRVLGVDLPLAPPPPGPALYRRLIGRNTRLAETYRRGRVFLAGDAAHTHSASGGPGLNLGLQDAANLAWKLAAAIRGSAPPGLLDTYDSERHPLGERVFVQTQAQTTLMSPGPGITALRQLFTEFLERKENAQAIADLMAGADVRYAPRTPEPSPLAGWFAPDLTLTTGEGPRRLAELMRGARPLLLDLGAGGLRAAANGWSDRVDVIEATALDAPAGGLLIRPDGYVAWAAGASGEASMTELEAALTAWFGSSRAAT